MESRSKKLLDHVRDRLRLKNYTQARAPLPDDMRFCQVKMLKPCLASSLKACFLR
jgi:hypothetical protein